MICQCYMHCSYSALLYAYITWVSHGQIINFNEIVSQLGASGNYWSSCRTPANTRRYYIVEYQINMCCIGGSIIHAAMHLYIQISGSFPALYIITETQVMILDCSSTEHGSCVSRVIQDVMITLLYEYKRVYCSNYCFSTNGKSENNNKTGKLIKIRYIQLYFCCKLSFNNIVD